MRHQNTSAGGCESTTSNLSVKLVNRLEVRGCVSVKRSLVPHQQPLQTKHWTTLPFPTRDGPMTKSDVMLTVAPMIRRLSLLRQDAQIPLWFGE